MSLPISLPQFQPPPAQYSQDYFEALKHALEEVLVALNANGTIVSATFMATRMPNSGYGLRSGQMFESEGVLYIVRDKDIFFAPFGSAAGRVGAVTTTP